MKDMFAKKLLDKKYVSKVSTPSPAKPPPKQVEVTVKLDMNERTAKLFLQSALERVINTSMEIAEKSNHDFAYINGEDWNEWKPVVVMLWHAVREGIYREMGGLEKDDRVYTLHKGEL